MWVESKDGLVGGFIDYVYNLKEGPVICDYKSGNIFDESSSNVKPGYETQLRLYAALYHTTTGIWPARLEIVPLQGTHVEVRFEPDECVQLLEDAILTTKRINSLIESLQSEPDE